MIKSALTLVFSILFLSAIAQENPGANSEPPAKRGSISVTPARLEFQLDRGGIAKKSITLNNTTKKKQMLNMEFMDWTRDTFGNHMFYPPKTSKQSCASWVTFDRPSIELGPGESAVLTITMNVPDSAEAVSEMKWTMLVVKSLTEKLAPTPGVLLETQIRKSMGLGIHILQTPPNITNKEIQMLSFEKLPDSINSYRIISKNTGGKELSCKYSLELSSNETGTKTVLASKIAPLFPMQKRYMDFTLPSNIPKGKYTAIALIDANDDEVPIEAVQKEIVVK